MSDQHLQQQQQESSDEERFSSVSSGGERYYEDECGSGESNAPSLDHPTFESSVSSFDEPEWRSAERHNERKVDRLRIIHHMCHVPLRDAADTLRAGAGDSASEAETLEAIAVVRQFAESKKRVTRALTVASGVIPYLVALVFDTKGIKSSSGTVQEAALNVLKLLVQREGDDACRVVASTIDPCAIPALLQGGGDGRSVALAAFGVAKWCSPPQRNAMLAAGAGPALVELASLADESSDAKEARSVINSAIHLFNEPPTVAQARAALPGLLECARRPEATLYALQLIRMLVSGGTEAHVQAALDVGAAKVVAEALRSDADDVVVEACEVLSKLTSGSAEQLATLLDAGVVAALCASRNFETSNSYSVARAMEVFGDCRRATADEKQAYVTLFRGRLVPQLLAVLANATAADGRLECGAALWLSKIAANCPETEKVLWECGAVEVLLKFLSVKKDVDYATSIVPAIDTLTAMRAATPLESVALARAALPALLRLRTSETTEVGSAVIRCATALIEWRTHHSDELLQPDEYSVARVQAAFDSGYDFFIRVWLRMYCTNLQVDPGPLVSACVVAGSADHVRHLLRAGLVGPLCYVTVPHFFSSTLSVKAAVLLVEAAVALQNAAACDGDANLVESHVLPQLREAAESERYNVGAVLVLQDLTRASAQCRAAVFRPDILAALARVAGSGEYRWDSRVRVFETLHRLCEAPPPLSTSVAHQLLPLLLPLCNVKHREVAELALASLHALAKVIPEVVDQTLRENNLPLPPQQHRK